MHHLLILILLLHFLFVNVFQFFLLLHLKLLLLSLSFFKSHSSVLWKTSCSLSRVRQSHWSVRNSTVYDSICWWTNRLSCRILLSCSGCGSIHILLLSSLGSLSSLLLLLLLSIQCCGRISLLLLLLSLNLSLQLLLLLLLIKQIILLPYNCRLLICRHGRSRVLLNLRFHRITLNLNIHTNACSLIFAQIIRYNVFQIFNFLLNLRFAFI